ncbi:MAG: GGDEF domain-containing protein, partial [Defluviitaleaceae bacterium]|nr:GGDEF domain-containing protein [Defluviitaleaceae bacterium]
DGRILYKNKIARELLLDAETLDKTPLLFETRPQGGAPGDASPIDTRPVDRHTGRVDDESQADLVYNKNINGKWFRITRYPVKWPDDTQSIMFCGLDYSEIKESEQLMNNSMYTDSMTGIYNRQFAMEILSKYTEELGRGGHYFTACYLDLDGLKYVNDTFGHAQGDEYIMAAVAIIKGAVRQTDIFARIGGDEFLVLFPKCPHAVVSNIMENVERRLEIKSADDDKGVRYAVSYGIYEVRRAVGGRDTTVEDIMRTVDAKMYDMKNEHRKLKANQEPVQN